MPRKIKLVLVVLGFFAGAEKKAVLWAGRLLTETLIFLELLNNNNKHWINRWDTHKGNQQREF